MVLSLVRPFGSTFFVFTDYMRPSIRLSAIMQVPSIWIFTHDSIGVGEDGPTHEPIEHLASLRAIPQLITLRPGDANEVAEAYRALLKITDRPVALILSRQNLPTLDRAKYAPAAGVARGAYVLADADGGQPRVLLLGTGSELSLCVEAYERLKQEGIAARVVSMPSWELFEAQDQAYRDSVLPPSVTARVAVEAGCPQGWDKYIGPRGRFVGMHGYGASAPGAALFKEFGITTDHVVSSAKAALENA
jgi:transketolase